MVIDRKTSLINRLVIHLQLNYRDLLIRIAITPWKCKKQLHCRHNSKERIEGGHRTGGGAWRRRGGRTDNSRDRWAGGRTFFRPNLCIKGVHWFDYNGLSVCWYVRMYPKELMREVLYRDKVDDSMISEPVLEQSKPVFVLVYLPNFILRRSFFALTISTFKETNLIIR